MAGISLSPIGLFFATVVPVLLAFGEVCNKKIVQGQNVAAAVFWIRLFSLLEIIAVMLVFARKGSPPIIHPVAALAQGDLENTPALVEQLRNPANDMQRSIAANLSEATHNQIYNYRNGVDDAELAKSLSADLNSSRIIEGTLLYNARNSSGVTLSAETLRVLSMKPHGETEAYANRLLVQDMFPGAIAGGHGSALFGLRGVTISPRAAFFTYLFIEVILVATSQLLTSFALKVSAISLCIPFTTFTPIFLLGTGYVILRELILMSDPLTTAFGYGIATVLAFGILLKVMHIDVKQVMRQKPGWAVLAGLSDANTMFAQFIAVMYLPVVIAICIKRAGIVLTILAGWLVFKEHDITDRLIAALAMMGGVAIFYLKLQMAQALTLTVMVIAAVATALYLTRRRPAQSALAVESAS